MSDLLTIDQFKKVLPNNIKKVVTQELVDNINKIQVDPEFREAYRDNILSYTNVMTQGKFKINNYLDAVRYVSFKLLGHTNIDAYVKTFPVKYQHFLNQGVASKDIASYVTAYNKSKLVNLIYEQTIVPVHVLNQDKAQEAINVLTELMYTAKSEKVKGDAANNLLTHLKMPEVKKYELDINTNQDTLIEDYEKTITRMVEAQKQLIEAGGDVKAVANTQLDIVDAEIVA